MLKLKVSITIIHHHFEANLKHLLSFTALVKSPPDPADIAAAYHRHPLKNL